MKNQGGLPVYWWLLAAAGLGLCFLSGWQAPVLATGLLGLLALITQLTSVTLPGVGFFSTAFAPTLALASGHPEQVGAAGLIWVVSLLLRSLLRGGGPAACLVDLAPGTLALAAMGLVLTWQGRCLLGITLYYFLSEMIYRQFHQSLEVEQRNLAWTTWEWTQLYRWAVLFLAPLLICVDFFSAPYVLLGLPILAGVQRAAYSELARLKLLDQEILLRQQAQDRNKLSQTQSELDQTQRHLRLREFSESMLLELTASLARSQDVSKTAQAALQALGGRVHYRQMAIFVYRQERLKPLFWMGQPEQPEIPMMLEQQLADRPLVDAELSLWPLEREGALLVDTRGQAPLTSEEIYLIGLVAYQSTLGLQSARRFLEHQQSQAAVLMASKMAAVGQLAAGVAHELNTPLGAVQLQLELLEMRAQLDAAGQKALSVAFNSLEHSQKIISRLLYYSRDGASERQPFDLNVVVEDTLQMLEHQLKIDKVELGKQLCADCTALINANEIQQVLTNLILNAKDSCQEKGAVGRRILIRTACSGAERWLEVLDQGAGVPQEIAERIFEPFFTSKPVGKGVGLGLSVSLELVQQNGGKLTCMPGQPPWATVFRLILPGA